eukprot:CAMPEP_0196574592 /NCGR_PEP_ID=MMETSP1081-20130531/4285_1 /TAXON_ID=36882 /ORGANISM="Pyramimonas amylifera, Strain CCMP720" /LENGTH=511 /DNA_ID=CAMNT_0041892671 /DNA_START=118 /DNA_END=1653 /DNA_ORIENTATION=+
MASTDGIEDELNEVSLTTNDEENRNIQSSRLLKNDELSSYQIPSKDHENTLPVFFAVALAVMGPLMFGFSLGFTSPISASLTGPDCTSPSSCPSGSLSLTSAQLSLFGSIINVGAMVGAAAGGHLTDQYGRRTALTLAALPFLAGYMLMAVAPSYALLVCGRVLTGVGVGIVSLACPIYIAEISPAKLRGMLGAANQLALTVGILLVYVCGLEALGLSWRGLACVGLVPPTVLLFAGIFYLPETPRWLCAASRVEEAAASLRRLRGRHADVDTELLEIQDTLSAVAGQPKASYKDLFVPGMRAQMLIVVGSMMLQQFSGVNAVVFYSANILRDAGVEQADIASLAVAGIQVVMTVVCCQLMDRAGRRALLLTSAGGMAASASLLATYFLCKQSLSPAVSMLVSVGSLMGYIIFFSLGLGAIPWVLMSEIFPAHTRGQASSLATFINWSCSFLVTEVFKSMMDTLTPAGAFMTYAFELLATVLFVFVLVPETKGRSLEQIEAYFLNKERVLQ